MKKYLPTVIALLLFIGIFSSCKKEDTATQAKDYTVFIKDKTWWGTLTNAGEGPQYYSVHFNADNTLIWSQLSGDYAGKWNIDKNKLTMTFTSPAVIVTADISDDNKLTNIATNTANKVNSGEVSQNPNLVLENTTWVGTRTYNHNFPPQLLQYIFVANSKVQIRVDNGVYGLGTYAYTRIPSGGAIRITDIKHFGIIASANEMKGSEFTYDRDWRVFKQ